MICAQIVETESSVTAGKLQLLRSTSTIHCFLSLGIFDMEKQMGSLLDEDSGGKCVSKII